MDSVDAILSSIKAHHPEDEDTARGMYIVRRKEARKYLPELTEQLKDRDPKTRRGAALGLGALFRHPRFPVEEKPVSLLLGAMEDSEPDVRLAAYMGLVVMGCRASGLEKLISWLSHENPLLRKGACRNLAAWEGNLPTERPAAMKEAAPKLIQLLKDQDEAVREAAIRALGSLQVRESIPSIKALLEDEEARVRRAAAEALRELGVDPTKK